MMAGDDDDDRGGDAHDDDDGKFSEKPSKGSSKGKGNDDDDDGRFSEKPSKSGKKGRSQDDDDRPRKSGGDAAAAAGMGIGMILLIVGGLVACCLCVPGILAALLIPAVQKVREAAARTQAMNNMMQISLASHNYHNTHNFFPSPRMQTAEMSWRVELLPYMEEMNMFNQINKNAAWDNPANAASRPRCRRCSISPANSLASISPTRNSNISPGQPRCFPIR